MLIDAVCFCLLFSPQLNKYVSLSVEIEDTTGKLHRFTISNSCTVVRIRLDSADLPLTLTQGWNKLTLNLADLTQACFNSTYSSTHRVRILASCRLRRVYFSDQAYPDFALPSCLRIFSQAFYDAQRRERATEAAEEGEQATEGAEGRGNRRKGAQEEKEQSKPRPSRLREQLQGELAAARALESQMDPLNSDSGEASNQLFEHRLLDSQEARILAKHAETRASWAAFKSQTAARLGVRETDLNISRTDHFRAKQEELALLVHSIPESEKQGAGREEMWAGSLRGTGDSYVGVGNMFSGLWTKVKSNANPKVEIVRKPAATR
jgi:hypothetical protein